MTHYFLQHIGYVFTFLAISIKDVLWLRSVLAIAQILLGIYQWLEGRIDIVLWNCIFTLVNFYHIYRIFDERKPIKVPSQIYDIYKNNKDSESIPNSKDLSLETKNNNIKCF